MSTPHASVSIVCVYNDLAIRQQCLDRSIQALIGDTSDVEYLPIDNVRGTYRTAGAALNHGASLATGEVVAFVHQDVFLHSLMALKEAAGQMAAGGFGMLGAVGARRDGGTVGRVRDRVAFVGDAVTDITDVDSLDEVLFMVPRSHLHRDPLTESADMAWHGYAVEYGLRARTQGLRIGVANIPLTHNSLRTNLDGLDIAHQAIAARYADLLPVRTTCGVITRKTAKAGARTWLASHRWRYNWLRESLMMQGARSAAGRRAALLADIREDVDSVIDRSPGRRLYVVNRSELRHSVDGESVPLELARGEGSVVIVARDISGIPTALGECPPGSWLLITNLSRADLKMISSWLPTAPGVLGFHTGIGFWLLQGPVGTDLPPQWCSKKATPLRIRAFIPEPSL
jgi:Glycosyltransferase like family